jgi:tRNA 2-thiouridine synthesizing protein E
MAAIELTGRPVEVDDDGYLVDPNDWTKDVAVELARGAGIELGERHWAVIEFCRNDWASTGEAPGLRRITKVGGIPTKEIYKLFPGGPGKLAAKIAGLGNPVGCV